MPNDGFNIRMIKLQANFSWRAIICTFLLFSIAACDSGDDEEEAAAAPSVDPSTVRIINAIPDAPTLSLIVNDEAAGVAPFGQASNGFSSSDGGTVTLSVVYNTADGVTENFLDNLSVPISNGREIYILLTGTFASPITSVIDNPVFAIDSSGSVASSTSLNVQFGDSVNNGQAVDIYLTQTDAVLTASTPAATLSFDGVSTLENFSAASDYRIRITAVGSTDVLYDSGTITLSAIHNQIFMLVDYFGPGDAPFRVISISNGVASTIDGEELPSELRVANFITNTPSVDFYFNDTNDAPEFTAVSFGEFTSYMTFDVGEMSINITPNGENTNFLYEQNLTLIAGASRTLVLAGDPTSDNGVSGRVISDSDRPIATQLQLKFIHASAGSGTIDFYVLESSEALSADTTPDVTAARFLSNANIPVALGTYDLVATLNGETTILAGPTRLSVDVGIYSIILSESPNGGAPFTISVLEESFD